MENQSNNMKVIALGDLWRLFLHRFWIILLVTILAVATVYTSLTMTFEPRYNSTATLYILQQNQTNPDRDYEDFNLALKVVNDCTHLIKSHSVLDEVIRNLKLNIPYSELYKNITITNPTDTRILEVTVESVTPESAKIIVDEVCTVGTWKITEAMGFEQVNFYETGVLNSNPCNKPTVLIYLIVGFLAALVTYSIFLISYILDDKIRTDEDIKNYLSLSILGDIPNFDNTKKKKYGGKYYRSRYYGKKYYQRNIYGKEDNN